MSVEIQTAHAKQVQDTTSHPRSLKELKTLPCVISKTSMHQTLHIPQRLYGVGSGTVEV